MLFRSQHPDDEGHGDPVPEHVEGVLRRDGLLQELDGGDELKHVDELALEVAEVGDDQPGGKAKAGDEEFDETDGVNYSRGRKAHVTLYRVTPASR